MEAVQKLGISRAHLLLPPTHMEAQPFGSCCHTDGGDRARWSPGASVALPHLHLHAQAVEEVSREGQAVHGRERGVNPAWGDRRGSAFTALSCQVLGGRLA